MTTLITAAKETTSKGAVGHINKAVGVKAEQKSLPISSKKNRSKIYYFQ